MKKDSIVRKQMLLYMTTIGVLIMLLCGSLAVIYTNHYMGEKKNELIVQGEKIANAYTAAYRTGDMSGLSRELQILETYMESGIVLVNKSGTVVLTSPGFDEERPKFIINRPFIYAIQERSSGAILFVGKIAEP